jgi:hypothetical protein
MCSRRCEFLLSMLQYHKPLLWSLVAAMYIPVTLAANQPTIGVESAEPRAPIFMIATSFDYTMLGLMALYLLTVFTLRWINKSIPYTCVSCIVWAGDQYGCAEFHTEP